MRRSVLVASVMHETNTFVPDPVGREAFQQRREFLGDDVTDAMADTDTAIGGVIRTARELGISLVQTVATFATPGGVVTDDAYEFYADVILDAAERHRDELDGVVLPLHGAMVVESLTDGEGELIGAVREVVGPDVPIVVTLDLHGNVSEAMVAEADAIVAYETNPHLDKGETGRRGMELLARAMDGDVDPVIAMERPPVLPEVPKQFTSDDPMARVMARARELEDEHDDVLKVNVLPGFYHADVPEAGLSIPVVTDGDEELARDVAASVGELIWELREQFVGDYPTPAEAVAKAKRLGSLAPEPGPIVMADFGPNPGAGGSASGTALLREFLDQGVENAGYTLLWGPDAVEACIEAGVGERVTITIGGWPDDHHGAPIEDVDGYVKTITDGTFVNTGTSHDGKGTTTNLGRAVLFQCGQNDGVNVILTETRASSFDAEIWRHVGIQPERLDVIAVQSLAAFRGDYGPFASSIIEVDSPGLSSPVAERFEYKRLERPKFPLDDLPDDAYRPRS